MTDKSILLSALRNERTPRPAWVPFVGVHGATLIGETADRYLQQADLLIRGLHRARELYRPDGLPVVFDLQMEAEILGCALKWNENSPPAVTTHPLTQGTLADLPAFDLAGGRYPLVARVMAELKAQWGDEMALYGLVTGPFTLALHLLGTEIFLKMYDDPDAVKQVLAFTADVGRQAARFYIDQGADIVAVVDPMTSQISPQHFGDFVSPFVEQVFTTIRERNVLSSFFVCGNATRNLELMCRTPCDNISVDENISLEQLRELAGRYGKSFGGNLKLTTVLLLGTEDDARHDALRCLDIGGEQGFVLAPGCDLPFYTPPANIQAATELVFDAYRRDVVRATAQSPDQAVLEEILLPAYDQEDKVIVDVVTLDSASCAPCQYMVSAVEEAARRLGNRVVIREHKITTRSGLGYMARLGVGQIPTICIDGEVKFPSIIPDVETLVEALNNRVEAKTP